MAYKYAKGKIYRGDIYNEDDTQRNTFIDFSEDAVGIIVGNTEGLVVSGSGAVSSSLNVSASGFYGDGSGLSGITATASPAGSDGQIQYNNGGSAGGAASLYWRDDSDRLGIGTANPSKALDIEGADNAIIQLNATNYRSYNVGSDGYGFVVHDATTGGIAGYRLVISDMDEALGYVGLGAGASIAGNNHPDALLHLSSSDDGAIFRVDTTGGHDNAATLLYATGSGRVGVGTSQPSTAFHVYGEVSSDYLTLIDNDNSSAAHALKVTTDGNGSGTYVLDLEAKSTTLFRVRGDGRVGIGKVTSLPSACLTVSGSSGDGDIAVASKIQHIGDSDTYIEFEDDIITLAAGGRSFLKLEEASGQDKLIVNHGGLNIDLKVSGQNDANLIRTDAANDRVGIGTGSPTSTFEISGSQAGNYTQTAGNITFNETHYVVDYTGNGNATFTLPATSGVTGRQYHILCHAQGGGDKLTITGSGGAFQGTYLEGDASSVDIDGNTPQSITVLSTGTNWFILHDGRSEE